jgi:hypothetical protein
MKQIIEIEVPDGHELRKTETGFEVVPVNNLPGLPIEKIENAGYDLAEIDGEPCVRIAYGYAPTKQLWGRCIALENQFKWEMVETDRALIMIPSRKH